MDHVLGKLGDLVGVLALALDALLHDRPEQRTLALPLLLLLDIAEPGALLPGLGAAPGLGAGGDLDLDGGDQSLLHVDRPLGLSGGDLQELNLTILTILHLDLEGGLKVLLVLPSELGAALQLDRSPVLGPGASQLLIEGAIPDVPHLELVVVLGDGLDIDLALEGHPGEGGVQLGDASEHPAGVIKDQLPALWVFEDVVGAAEA